MVMTSALKSTTSLTPALKALLAETAGDDLPPGLADLIKLMQGMSAEMAPNHTKYVDGAALGDFVIPPQDEQLLVKGAIGYAYMVVGAECHWPEYLQARGGFVAPHDTKPPNARWLKKDVSPDGRAGLYLIGLDGRAGNRIEETWYVPELILLDDGSKPFVATYAFHGTACPIGMDMLRRAARKVMVDGEPVSNPALVKWRMTSRPEKGNGGAYYLPEPTIVGRFGEERGPTSDQVELAAQLRKAFRQGLPIGEEPPEPPAPALDIDDKPIVVATARPVITSGRPVVRAVETAPPLEHDGGPDEGFYSDTPF
jgi:hypothetical protein